jgi:hypothetical protein
LSLNNPLQIRRLSLGVSQSLRDERKLLVFLPKDSLYLIELGRLIAAPALPPSRQTDRVPLSLLGRRLPQCCR